MSFGTELLVEDREDKGGTSPPESKPLRVLSYPLCGGEPRNAPEASEPPIVTGKPVELVSLVEGALPPGVVKSTPLREARRSPSFASLRAGDSPRSTRI